MWTCTWSLTRGMKRSVWKPNEKSHISVRLGDVRMVSRENVGQLGLLPGPSKTALCTSLKGV